MIASPPQDSYAPGRWLDQDQRMTGQEGNPLQSLTPREQEIDWEEASRFLRACLEKQLPSVPEQDLFDLVQEALVGALRTARREPVRNVRGLLHDIARKAALSYLRRRSRWRALLGRVRAYGDPPDVAAPLPPDAFGEPLERFRFVVLEFFRQNSPACHDLALRYFGGETTWSELAGELGRRPDAVRRQWSRCVAALRREAASGKDPSDRDNLWNWTRQGDCR